MSINLQDFDSKFSDNSLIKNKNEVNQRTAVEVQKQQTRIINWVYLLYSISQNVLIGLSLSILNQDPSKISVEGRYSLKYLTSFLYITGDFSSIIWGFISDRIGRKKSLNISLLGSALSMALYGLCKSFNSLAFVSAIIGVFSCKNIFINTMLAESNCKASRPEAFSSLFIRSIMAIFTAQAISSLFSVPHLHDLVLDANTASVTRFPYLIPSLIASFTSFVALILSYIYLNETLIHKESKLDGYLIADIPTDQTVISTKLNQIKIFGLNFSKNSLLLLTVDSLLILVYNGYDRVIQDWPTLELSKGGLNLKSDHILAVSPLMAITAVTILIKYRHIYKKISAINQFKVGFVISGILLILSLILTLVAKIESTFKVLSLYAILVSIGDGINVLTSISFDLLLSESAESSGNLGTLYGISRNLLSVIFLVLPYVFNALSILNIENNLPFPFNDNLTWLLVILSLIGYWLSSKIKLTV
jgi:MFS family permease